MKKCYQGVLAPIVFAALTSGAFAQSLSVVNMQVGTDTLGASLDLVYVEVEDVKGLNFRLTRTPDNLMEFTGIGVGDFAPGTTDVNCAADNPEGDLICTVTNNIGGQLLASGTITAFFNTFADEGVVDLGYDVSLQQTMCFDPDTNALPDVCDFVEGTITIVEIVAGSPTLQFIPNGGALALPGGLVGNVSTTNIAVDVTAAGDLGGADATASCAPAGPFSIVGSPVVVAPPAALGVAGNIQVSCTLSDVEQVGNITCNINGGDVVFNAVCPAGTISVLPEPRAVPSMSQWGLYTLVLLTLGLGIGFAYRRLG